MLVRNVTAGRSESRRDGLMYGGGGGKGADGGWNWSEGGQWIWCAAGAGPGGDPVCGPPVDARAVFRENPPTKNVENSPAATWKIRGFFLILQIEPDRIIGPQQPPNDMISGIYYLFLVLLCTLFMVLSAVALVLCYPFDKGRRVVHELSRILVRIFFFIPLRWRQRVIGRELIDRKKRYVIVVNHNTVFDIPTLYYIPLNFRWVSKREVFKVPFFGQYLVLHGDICIDRGRAAEAMEQLLREGRLWISRGASVAIFPEGTRSKDGEIHRFKAGAFTLAREAGVEILPVVLDGTRTIVRRNLMFNWGNRITIRVLPPVSREEIASTEVHELMARVHDRMAAALAEIRQEGQKA